MLMILKSDTTNPISYSQVRVLLPGLQAIAFHVTVTHHSRMAADESDPKRQSRGRFPSSINLIDALPTWAKVIVFVLGGACFVYSVAHYGLGSTLLHAIFSP